MKRPMMLLALVAAAVSGAVGARWADEPTSPRVQKLLRDRLALHQQIVDYFTKLQATGASSTMETEYARRGLLAAEYDAADSKEQRIDVLQRIVLHEKKIADTVSRLPETGAVDKLNLRIRALDAEIALEREKLK